MRDRLAASAWTLAHATTGTPTTGGDRSRMRRLIGRAPRPLPTFEEAVVIVRQSLDMPAATSGLDIPRQVLSAADRPSGCATAGT
ncbi:MAG: hypothetical protein IPM11_11295 [Micropruina sp.]|nr:hypothetical protein [Micropruina sp.]